MDDAAPAKAAATTPHVEPRACHHTSVIGECSEEVGASVASDAEAMRFGKCASVTRFQDLRSG